MRTILSILSLLTLTQVLPAGAATSSPKGKGKEPGCSWAFSGLGASRQELDPEMCDRIAKRYNAKVLRGEGPTRAEIETFLNSGWPELQKIAAEEGKTPADLAGELAETLESSAKALENPDHIVERFTKSRPVFMNAARWMHSQKDLAKKKLRPQEQQAVIGIMKMTEVAAMFSMAAEVDLYGLSTVNPLLPQTAEQVRHIFKAVEDVSGEATLSLLVGKSKSAHPDLEELASAEKPLPEKHVELKETAPHLPPESPPEPPVTKISETPVELKAFLEPGGKLIDGQTYRFRNAVGEDYLIRFSDEISKDARKGHERSIKRLLSSLYMTNNGKSGIKFLSSMGKNMVEIKAVLRGHKRLIGCLKGRELVIKKFYDIPASVDAYFKLIPPNLCED